MADHQQDPEGTKCPRCHAIIKFGVISLSEDPVRWAVWCDCRKTSGHAVQRDARNEWFHLLRMEVADDQ